MKRENEIGIWKPSFRLFCLGSALLCCKMQVAGKKLIFTASMQRNSGFLILCLPVFQASCANIPYEHDKIKSKTSKTPLQISLKVKPFSLLIEYYYFMELVKPKFRGQAGCIILKDLKKNYNTLR